MKPTRTVRDDRGTTRYLDVTPTRAVRWWWDRYIKLWVVEVADEKDYSRSYGCSYGQLADVPRMVASVEASIKADPEADSYRHY